MTLTQAETILHNLYSGDNTVPDSSSAEWEVRKSYLNAAINAWDTEIGVFWNELWTTLTAAATGSKTVLAATLSYSAPDDFRFLGGYISTGTTPSVAKWQIFTPQKSVLHDGAIVGLTDGNVYITGNSKTGYKVNFSSQPTVGDTIAYPYYKQAASLSSGSDIFEMSDPYFAIYHALSKMHEQDGEGDRATFAMSQAESKLTAMKVINAQLPNYQTNAISDSTIVRTNLGFGA